MKCVKIIEEDYIVSTSELAKVLGVSARTVQNLTNQGYLYPVKNYKQKGTRSYFYRLTKAIACYERYLFYKITHATHGEFKPLDKVCKETIAFYDEDLRS